MPDPVTLVLVLAIVFVATLAHAALGFGTALVCMPLLVLVLGTATTVPFVGLVVLTVIVLMLRHDRSRAEPRDVWRLLAATAVGTPLGLVMLKHAPDTGIRYLLGAVVIAYSVFNLARPPAARDSTRCR